VFGEEAGVGADLGEGELSGNRRGELLLQWLLFSVKWRQKNLLISLAYYYEGRIMHAYNSFILPGKTQWSILYDVW
jgi:hypothetical protein